MLRKIYRSIQENGMWRKRYNHELYNLYNDVLISKKAKISRMKWARHVIRMNDEEPTKKLMLGKPDGTRRNGRPKLRWIDGLEKDLHNISIRNLKNIALDRSRWRRCLEQAIPWVVAPMLMMMVMIQAVKKKNCWGNTVSYKTLD
jgi:hypothetical protein